MWQKNYRILLIVVIMVVAAFSCSKEKKAEQQEQEIGSISSGTEQQKFDVTTNYDSLLTVVTDLTGKIQADPSNVNLRKELVSACYDNSIDMIVAPGAGKPVQNAPTPSVAKELKERAAKIEAYRWAYIIKQWHQDPSQPMPEKMNVELPPARIVSQKSLPDSSVQVLVVLSAQKVN